MNGFRAAYSRWPSHGLTVIVLTNLSNAPYEGVAANGAIQYVPELKRAPPRLRPPPDRLPVVRGCGRCRSARSVNPAFLERTLAGRFRSCRP